MSTGNNINYLVTSVKDKLRERGYSPNTIFRYQRCWNQLLNHMHGQEIESYSPKIGLDFLREVYNVNLIKDLTKQQRFRARAVKLLNDFVETGTIYPAAPRISAAKSLNVFGKILSGFKQYQVEKYEVSKKTIENYDKYIGRFLLYLENHISDISCLTQVLILKYCKCLVEYTDGIAHNASCSLRVFLRYINTMNLVDVDFSYKVPSFAYSRKARLPSTFTPCEVKKVLGSINRSSTVGKRDYAIILMAWRLGLRSGDIRMLEFKNIYWESNTIKLVIQKTGKTIILPLLEDVGMAIIDYIKYARPVTSSKVVFQTCNAPIKPISASGMSSIVKKAAYNASIETSPHRPLGPHIMRSTLASAMLAEEIPLPVISGILGHSSTRTTQEYYLRIDNKQLRRCALDVPRFSWEPKEEVF
jgi:integrase/recombinase XerD